MYITVGVFVDSAMSLSCTSLFGISVTADAIVLSNCDKLVSVDEMSDYEELENTRFHPTPIKVYVM